MKDSNGLKSVVSNGVGLGERKDLFKPHADLERWKKLHPRASKTHPLFFVDFEEEGSIEPNPACYSWSNIVWLIKERDEKVCRVCGHDGSTCRRVQEVCDVTGTRYTDGIEVQHIIPQKDGGKHHPKNLITICRRCHLTTFKKGYGGVPLLDKHQTKFKGGECDSSQD